MKYSLKQSLVEEIEMPFDIAQDLMKENRIRMKYSLKNFLLSENNDAFVMDNTIQFFEALAAKVDKASGDSSWLEVSVIDGNCKSVCDMEHVEHNEVWLNNIKTLSLSGKPESSCYRKGYSSRMLGIICQTADEFGITLELIAAPEPWDLRRDPTLPKKEQLAQFYGKHGFNVKYENHAQIGMRREPKL